jgi:hypothetical protein
MVPIKRDAPQLACEDGAARTVQAPPLCRSILAFCVSPPTCPDCQAGLCFIVRCRQNPALHWRERVQLERSLRQSTATVQHRQD